jgi:hypothetical protein
MKTLTSAEPDSNNIIEDLDQQNTSERDDQKLHALTKDLKVPRTNTARPKIGPQSSGKTPTR